MTPSASSGSRRVLVCDDSLVARRFLGQLLTTEGFEVELVGCGETAFTRANEDHFDLVLSSIRVGGLSGVQLCRLLRADPATARTPFILLSAASDARSRFWGRNAGADAHLAKDRAAQTLIPEVQRLLRDHVPEPPRARRRAKPLERLSSVLDQLLFEAVIARRVAELIDVTEREEMARSLLALLDEVVTCEAITLVLEGAVGPSRHRFGGAPLGGSDPERTWSTPIEGTSERYGHIELMAGDRPLTVRAKETTRLVAREAVPVCRSLFLLEETRRLARFDHLTGLANRGTSEARLEAEQARAQREGIPLSLILADIDHFKSVNDTYGHPMGDAVLESVATVLREGVGSEDLAGRWGGEEFVVVLPGSDARAARRMGETLRGRVASSPAHAGGPRRVTLSMGVAQWRPGEGLPALLARADQHLYQAKADGRDRLRGDG